MTGRIAGRIANRTTADLETLLRPISDERPAGEDLRYVLFDPKKGIYWHDRIREAHRENIYEDVPKLPDWPVVIDLSTQALTSFTKDLQIAAWLSEALVKHHTVDRLAGLRDSLRLMRGLIENYWDEVYPEIDPEGDDGQFRARANIIASFDARLGFASKTIPLTESASGLKYSYLDWEEAKTSLELSRYSLELSRDFDHDEQERKFTIEDWDKAVNGTPYQFLKGRLELLLECSEELSALGEAIDRRFEREAPSLKELRRSLEEMTSLIKRLEREKRPPEVAAPAGETEGVDDLLNGSAAPPALSGSIGTRQEALRGLAEIAEYFRQSEPHSPVSYLVERAIKWGNMPLDVWLGDVVKEASILEQLRETLGIK